MIELFFTNVRQRLIEWLSKPEANYVGYELINHIRRTYE